MSVCIQIPTPLRQLVDGLDAVAAHGATVKEALEDLARRFPAITARLFENGQVRRFVNIYLNEEDIRYLANLETPVKGGDTISIIPAVAGG
jgi:molybdopterin synthase sulfur carrier subunit